MSTADPAAKTALRKTALRGIGLCVVSGLLAALAFSTHATAWLIWIAFVPWLYVLFTRPARAGSYAFHTWIFGMSFYIGIIHWLKELHPLTWLGGVTEVDSLMIVYGGIFGISLFVSIWTVGLGALLGWIKPVGWRQIVYPALLWMLMEYCQALGELSLPWARLAVSQYENLWLLQIVPHTGQLVVSGLIMAFNAALASFIIQFTPDPNPKPYWHYPGFRALSVVILLILADLGYGALQLAGSPAQSADDEKGIFVGVVQGSIPQGQKWGTPAEFWNNVAKTEKIYLDLTYELVQEKNQPGPSKDPQPGLLVWPESAVPVFPREMAIYQEHYRQLARASGSYFLTGSFDRLEPVNDAPIYNAAVLTEPDGTMKQWYYKRQRVPFGEYFPYRNFLTSIPLLGGIIDHLNPMHSDTAPGRDAALFSTRYGKLGTLICFESVYPQVARESVQAGANLLVIVTNDGWYKDAIALYQHLGHAVLRALENDRFVIRAGNTGISAFIDSHGRILAQSKPLDRVALSWRLPQDQLKQNLTLFTRFGDWPIWLSLLLILLAEILSKTKRTVNNEQ